MEIIRLPHGQMAPVETDCIKITETVDGQFTLVASALSDCTADNPESNALIAGEPYPTHEAAEAAGLAWAEEHCVATIYVETGGEPEPALRRFETHV